MPNLSNISKIIKTVFDGNDSYVKHHHHNFFKAFQENQTPKITLLTCSDSRVQVNILGFDATNQVFVVRNMGNQIMPVFGSIDYGVMHLKTPLLIIMGHTHCGAIKSVFSNYEDEPFDIIRELDHLSIPIRHLKHGNWDIEKDWLHIVEQSIDYQVKLATKKYHKLIEAGSLTIIGLIDDFINVYKSGEGRLIMINLNGEKSISKMKNHPVFKDFSSDQLNLILKRENKID